MPRKRKGVTAAQQRERFKKQQSSSVNGQLRCNQDNSELLSCTSKPDVCTVISGTLHQGDLRFQYPGIQCAFISLMALIRMTLKVPRSWTSDDINSCVIDGNYRFLRHCEALGIQPKMLLANELPKTIEISEDSFHCNQSDHNIEFGLLNPNMCDVDENDVKDIEKALLNGLNSSKSCLLFCGGLTIAIAKVESHFYSFDPHSRGKDGLIAPNGTAVLMIFVHLTDLVCYLEKLFFHSLELEPSEQFELVPFNITKTSREEHEVLLKSCSYNSVKLEATTPYSDPSRPMENKKDLPVEQEKNTSESMKFYFEDQNRRQKLFQEERGEEPSTNLQRRKDYIKNYMKKKA